jgi:DNA polymerase (family 10)
LTPVHNADIARIFEEIADLLEIQEANPFRVRANRNVARTVGDVRCDPAQPIESHDRLDLRYPGEACAASSRCVARARMRVEA